MATLPYGWELGPEEVADTQSPTISHRGADDGPNPTNPGTWPRHTAGRAIAEVSKNKRQERT
jgi:hypothetical protein